MIIGTARVRELKLRTDYNFLGEVISPRFKSLNHEQEVPLGAVRTAEVTMAKTSKRPSQQGKD